MRWRLGSIRARLIIGYWFAKAAMGRLLIWKRRQVRQTLLERYRADGLLPTSQSERAGFTDFQKCVACSLCTFSCTAISQGLATASFEPKFLLLAYSRSAIDREVFREEWMPCAQCQACTVECPNDVPLHQVIETLLARMRTSQPSPRF